MQFTMQIKLIVAQGKGIYTVLTKKFYRALIWRKITMTKEVELNFDSDEYEVVPLGPLRRLEKRLDKLENGATLSRDENLIRDILDIMKSNQKIVNDMVESTTQLRNSVSALTAKMDSVIDNLNSFMDLLKEASETSLETDISSDLGKTVITPISEKLGEVSSNIEKMAEGIKESNMQMLAGLEKLDKRLRRIYATQRRSDFFKPVRRPLEIQREQLEH